jgi:hypothetical protein
VIPDVLPDALQDVRQSVSALRGAEDRSSLWQSLAGLVRRTKNGSLEIDYRFAGDESVYAGPVLTRFTAWLRRG